MGLAQTLEIAAARAAERLKQLEAAKEPAVVASPVVAPSPRQSPPVPSFPLTHFDSRCESDDYWIHRETGQRFCRTCNPPITPSLEAQENESLASSEEKFLFAKFAKLRNEISRWYDDRGAAWVTVVDGDREKSHRIKHLKESMA